MTEKRKTTVTRRGGTIRFRFSKKDGRAVAERINRGGDIMETLQEIVGASKDKKEGKEP